MAKKIIIILLIASFALLTGCQEGTGASETLTEEDKREISSTVTDMVATEIESYGLLISSVFVYDYNPELDFNDDVWYEVKINVAGTSGMDLLSKATLARFISEISTGDIESATGKKYANTTLMVNLYGDHGLFIFNGMDGDVTLFEGDEMVIFNQTWESLGGESPAPDNVSKPSSENDTSNDSGTATVVTPAEAPTVVSDTPAPDNASVAEQLTDRFEEDAGLTLINISTSSLLGDGIFVRMIYDIPNTVYDFQSLTCAVVDEVLAACEKNQIDYYTISITIAENGTSLYSWTTDSSLDEPRDGTLADKTYSIYGSHVLCDEINDYLTGDDYLSKVAEELAPCTYEEYLAIETGMTYEEVCEIIGSEGTETATSGNIKIYDWDGDKKYSHVSVTFVDNEMHSKVQAGLD